MLKKKTHEMSETKQQFNDLKETLDCTWSIIQKTGGASLLQHLESECKLSQKAHLLLAVSDEAVADKVVKEGLLQSERVSGNIGNQRHNNRHQHLASSDSNLQHWLLG